ncbi:ABC transporter ATP-binding protein [Falsigemmobacter faecalis]|uniref:ABC transporter ATP-binding protein n=1 Tax=Falsigemmobacter faecalis TaxID=2488730 RepID=A0A3P3DCY1_9RHOB|nr:ABC transporter ATP-binding protein [Falsigemmobacter faecalis]RRH72183.1 ABC transporter ATP-binding protein [Falsigemmobacter faecalis]
MPVATQTALTLDKVSHAFSGNQVLSEVSLEIPAGQITCLLGQSGCGKSTLLRLISGIERPQSGRILGASGLLSGPEAFVEPEDRSIGFMFQDYALFPHLNVFDNIAFGLRRLPAAERMQRVKETAGHIGITHLLRRYPDALSGGEQQRVALARALAPRPHLILMDEPFSNLDQGLREKVRSQTLAILRDFAATAIVVTHDPQEALAMGDQIVLMRAGRVEQTGTPFEIYDHPVSPYAAEFIGPCNRLTGLWRQGHLETPIGTFRGALDLPEGSLALACIRPQALSLGQEGEGIPARVLSKTFVGESEQIELQIHPLGEPLRMHSHRRISAPVGAQVSLLTNNAEVHIFPRDGDDPEGAPALPGQENSKSDKNT